MPMAIPLIMAAGAMAEGATVVGALAALGGGVGMGSAILGGMVLAGSAMSTLGFITGNQKLSKYGGMIGLVGGVGAIANGAMNAATAKVATQAAIPSTDTALTNTPVANGVEQGAGATSGATQATSSQALAADPLTSAPAGPATSSQALAADPLTSAPYEPGLIENGLPTTSGPIQDLVPGTSGAPNLTNASNGYEGIQTSGGSGGYGSANPNPSPWQQIKNGATELGKWTKDNKELANIGGGLIQGGVKSWNEDRQLRKRFDMENEQEAQRRARFNESVRGLNMPTYQPPVRKA